jgi:transcriptional regulator with XRE-family HTH domain
MQPDEHKQVLEVVRMKAYDMSDATKRIGFWIYMKRREKGYTRTDLERLSGVSQYTIRNLELPTVESGNGPKLDTVIPLLKALGIEDPIGNMLGQNAN